MKKINLKKLLGQMTLDEKICQLVQVNNCLLGDMSADITGPWVDAGFTDEAIKSVGSALNFANVESMLEIQKTHMKYDKNQIPLVFMMDVIHGCRTIFPIPLAMGASFDEKLVEECSKMAGREASANGVQVTFTPMVDFVRDPRWGRVLETCSEDAYLNSRMGQAQVKGFQGENNDLHDIDRIATCVKHFAAYGGAEGGRDYNTVEISERYLRTYYLPAYKACLDQGAPLLMPSFNDLNGVPATVNEHLTEILRKEWKFDGVVISDYGALNQLKNHGIAKDDKEVAKLGFENQCDMEMVSTSYYKHLKELVKEGVFTEKQIDRSVMRILKLKERLGLFEDPFRGASIERAKANTLTKENREIARRASEESAILLKNDGVLPFGKDVKKIAIVGNYAEDKKIRGNWSCFGKEEECINIKEGVKKLLPNAEIKTAFGCGTFPEDTDKSGFKEAIKLAKWADCVLICIGEPEDYAGEAHSRATLDIPGVQEEFAEEIVKANKNSAVVLFNGRPLVLTKLNAFAPAILDVFFPGTEGGNAIANLVFGNANPSGKVTMCFPKALGQVPVYYNRYNTGRPKTKPDGVREYYYSEYMDCGNLPLYPFGYGLSYSKFEYESLELSKKKIDKDGEIKVKIKVKNVGSVDGKEVVQLYMRDLVASACRPIQELIGFEKVLIKAGETKTVEFVINEPMLRFYDKNMKFVSEKGEFAISTGYSDNLILTKNFELI